MNVFGPVQKRSRIQEAIGCDRCVLGIGTQHGKNVHGRRYQSVRVIPVPVPNRAVNTIETEGEGERGWILDIDELSNTRREPPHKPFFLIDRLGLGSVCMEEVQLEKPNPPPTPDEKNMGEATNTGRWELKTNNSTIEK